MGIYFSKAKDLPSAEEAQLIRNKREHARLKSVLDGLRSYINTGRTECALDALGMKDTDDYILIHMREKGYSVRIENRITCGKKGGKNERKFLVWGFEPSFKVLDSGIPSYQDVVVEDLK